MNKRVIYFFIVPFFLLAGIGLISCFYFGITRLSTVNFNQDKAYRAIVLDGQTGQPLTQAAIALNNTPAETVTVSRDANNEPGIFEIRLTRHPLEFFRRIDLTATAPGYLPGTISLTGAPWQDQPELRFNLVPTSITGQVTDAWTKEPLATVIRLSRPQTSTDQVPIETDGTGQFQMLRLEPPLTLRVEQTGYEPWQMELNSPDLFTKAAGYKLTVELTPRLTPGILRAADTQKPLAQVSLSASSKSRRQTITTQTDGTFEFNRLSPGDLITVQAPAGYVSTELVFDNQPELDLLLQLEQLLTVTVVNNFVRQPISGAEITLSKTITATTDDRGQAIFTQAPGAGQVVVTKSGYQPGTVDYQNRDGPLEIALAPVAWQGVVRDGLTGQPLPTTTIYIDDTALQTDNKGYFSSEALPKTEGLFVVKAAGYHRAYAYLTPTGILTAPLTVPFRGIEGQWLVTAPCVESPPVAQVPCLDLRLTPFQVKAIYIPFNYLRSREAILSYLDFVQATELNAIVVDVKGDFGFIGWDSQVDLVKTIGADEEHTPNWMPLDELIIEAKKRNVYTIARLVVFKDNPLAHGKPDLAVVREDGSIWIDGESLGWANPFKEEVWDYNIALAKEVAAFGFDELNFDYIRFPSDGNLDAIVYEEENTAETRTAAIREFIRRLTAALRPYRVFTSADVFGLTLWVTPESDMNIGQRVIDIAPQMDYLAPMVYPSTFIPGNLGYDDPSAEPYAIVYRSQEQAVGLVPAYVKIRPWLQGYWYSLDEMRLLKQAAADANSTGWAWWNAGGRYDDELFDVGAK